MFARQDVKGTHDFIDTVTILALLPAVYSSCSEASCFDQAHLRHLREALVTCSADLVITRRCV